MRIEITYNQALNLYSKQNIIIHGRRNLFNKKASNVFEILNPSINDIQNNKNEIFYLEANKSKRSEIRSLINKRMIRGIFSALSFEASLYFGIQFFYHERDHLNGIMTALLLSIGIFLLSWAMNKKEISELLDSIS